jgi:acetyl esterase/lipase
MPEDRSVLDRSAAAPGRSWSYGTGTDQVADIYLPEGGPDGAAPVLLIHGGFWRPEYDRSHLRPMAAELAAQGHLTVLPEYSRGPGRPDRAVADIQAALSALPGEIGASAPVIVGHSAGGHLGLVVAASPAARLLGCLALAPVADLAMAEDLDLGDGAVRDFLGTTASSRPDLDPARAPLPDAPVTVVHGEEDSLVPIRLSESFCARPGTRLVAIPATGHFELIDPLSRAWPSVIAELSALASSAGIE